MHQRRYVSRHLICISHLLLNFHPFISAQNPSKRAMLSLMPNVVLSKNSRRFSLSLSSESWIFCLQVVLDRKRKAQGCSFSHVLCNYDWRPSESPLCVPAVTSCSQFLTTDRARREISMAPGNVCPTADEMFNSIMVRLSIRWSFY